MKTGLKMGSIAVLAGAIGLASANLRAEQTQNRFAAELLEAHNQERAEFGAPNLKWSQRLARDAEDWAERLASEGRMRHASIDERGGAGENLWMGTAGYYSATTMIQSFAEEKRHFRPGEFPNVSRTGNWRDVGHYTQVVWRDTREVGCAVAKNERDDFLVCRYWPAGNIYGREIR